MNTARTINEKYPQRAPIRREIAKQYLGGKCATCGSTDRLEFDHIDPATKILRISQAAIEMPEVAFWLEVKKCQLLCREHHREKTLRERPRHRWEKV